MAKSVTLIADISDKIQLQRSEDDKIDELIGIRVSFYLSYYYSYNIISIQLILKE